MPDMASIGIQFYDKDKVGKLCMYVESVQIHSAPFLVNMKANFKANMRRKKNHHP